MGIKVGFTDMFPEALHPTIAAALPDGWIYEVTAAPTEEAITKVARESDILLFGGALFTDATLEAARRLRFIQKLGAGYNTLNMDLLKARGITVARLAGNNAVTVAEHAILLMLAVYRHLADADRSVRAGDWYKEEARALNREIRGKTVGVVGMGAIGRSVAARLRAFEAGVIYYDVRRAEPELEAALGIEYVALEDLLRRADIVTLHIPLFPETEGLINRERLGLMKHDAVLINCARGDIVDEPALVEALREGRLYGAGLDCFAHEREGGSAPFWGLRNVVLSPHIAGASLENFDSMIERAFSNAQKFVDGQPLPEVDLIWAPTMAKP